MDIENRLLGIITIDDIIDVIEQEDTEDFHRMAGISSPVEETYLKTSAFTITAWTYPFQPFLYYLYDREGIPLWLMISCPLKYLSGYGLYHTLIPYTW